MTNNYKSTPRNKLIADFCKNIGLIEKYGSGIRRIITYCNKQNLPVPEFRNISDGFMVTVFSDNFEKVGEKVGENLSNNQRRLIELIIKNNKITAKELSKELQISQRKVEQNIAILKSKKTLKRIGPDKGGHWEVVWQET